VLLPALSRQLKENKLKEAMVTQGKALELSLFFALPCAFALGVISDTLISFLFERGNFDAQDSLKVANALSALAIGLPAFIMIKIFTPRYFAQYDTTTPVKISAICIVANIILSIALSQVYSYVGIAMATSISAWINVSLLYYFQYKRKIFIIEEKSLVYVGKVFCSCLLMVVALVLFERIDFTINSTIYKFLIFISEILFGSVVYLSSSYFLKTLNFNFKKV
jgi:putative peptidoglycan lipid II flippase